MRALSEYRNRLKIQHYLNEAAACFRRLREPEQEADLLMKAARQKELAIEISKQAEADAEAGDQFLRDEMQDIKNGTFLKTLRKL